MEHLLHSVGHCGKFQLCHVTLVQACRFVTAWAQALMIFGLYNPGWRCTQTNGTTVAVVSSTPGAAQSRPSASNQRPPFQSPSDIISLPPSESPSGTKRTSGTVTGSTPFFIVLDAFENSTNAADVFRTIGYNNSCDVIDSCAAIEFNPASSTVVTRFGLTCDKVWIALVIVSVLNLGMLAGAFVGGQIGERFGRKVSMYGCNLLMALCCALAVFSPVWEVYALFMFFIGFGSVGVIATLSSLCMEFLNDRWRARVGSVPVWNISLILFALACAILKDWRYMHLLSAFLCGLACLGFFWTSESLRWLVVHGKPSQAKKVVKKMCTLNKRPIATEPLSQLIDEFDREHANRKYTYLDLLKTRKIRVITIKLTLIWVISVQVYDIIGFGVQALPGDFYTNIILLSMSEFPAVLINGWLANRLGRRLTGIVFASIGVVCCAVIVVALLALDQSRVRDHVITGMAFINRSSVQAILCFMVAYSTELVPTAVRNLAFGFFNISSRAVGIAAAYLLPRDYISMIICFAVLMASQAAAVGVFFSLTETKGKPLQDTMRAYEREAPTGHNESL